MARSRNVKPGLFSNEDLAECSIWARYIFPGLWMLADREGRLQDRPKKIKGELLPFDTVEVGPLLDELEHRGFIARYEARGLRVIQVVNFLKHQNPHFREAASTLPSAESLGLVPHTTNTKPQAQGGLKGPEASGLPEASPGLDSPTSDLRRGSSPADSLFSDSLIPDSGKETTSPAKLPTNLQCPQQTIRELYSEVLPSLPRAKKWDADRETALRARWRAQAEEKGWTTVEEGVAWFRRFFEAVSENDWAMGRSGRGTGHESWECNIDYLLTAKGFRRIIESDGRTKVAA